ncbi:MAG: RecB family exonuclease, partial [Terriglobia bacterium]
SATSQSMKSKLRLSATAVEDYRECPLRYRFQHLLKIPTAPQAALTFGSLMHQAARHYFELRRTSVPTFEEIERFYLERWRDTGFDDDYQADIYRKAGLEQLRGFVERHNALRFDAASTAFEQSFRFELDGIAVEGRIDQVNLLDGKGEVELIDYKTGRPRSEKDAQKSLQLSVYALGAERLGYRPVRLTFYNFSNNEPVSAVRTAEDLKETRREIQEAAEGIRQGRFEAKPGFICRWCDFTPLCPAHED